jgi:hypothetical protein
MLGAIKIAATSRYGMIRWVKRSSAMDGVNITYTVQWTGI